MEKECKKNLQRFQNCAFRFSLVELFAQWKVYNSIFEYKTEEAIFM